MEELLVGWIKWGDGRPIEHLMGRVVDSPVIARRSELGDMDQSLWEVDDQNRPRDPWQPGNYMLLKGLKDNAIYTFACGSRGGTNCIGEVSKAYGKVYRQHGDEFPVIALGVDSYMHKNKQYGRIMTPELKIVGWAPRSEFDEALLASQEEANAQQQLGLEQQQDQTARSGERRSQF
jgi:hypothetical protein